MDKEATEQGRLGQVPAEKGRAMAAAAVAMASVKSPLEVLSAPRRGLNSSYEKLFLRGDNYDGPLMVRVNGPQLVSLNRQISRQHRIALAKKDPELL